MRRLLLLPLLLTLSCSDNGPKNLVISISTDAASFKAGQNLQVSVTVANLTSNPRTISTLDCPRPFEVVDADGQVVGPGGEICAAFASFRTLAAGETHTFQFQWDGTAVIGGDAVTSLPPGEYMLRGAVVTDGGRTTGGAVEVRIVP